jgi:hypothetical protein
VGDREVLQVIERALADPTFFQTLSKAPDTVLADFNLSPEEHATFLKALQECRGKSPAHAAKTIRLHFVDRRAT